LARSPDKPDDNASRQQARRPVAIVAGDRVHSAKRSVRTDTDPVLAARADQLAELLPGTFLEK
jgi:hypothetical protein